MNIWPTVISVQGLYGIHVRLWWEMWEYSHPFIQYLFPH